MITLLLAATLSCADGLWILNGIADTDISSEAKNEMVITVLESMPDNCEGNEHESRSRKGSSN